MVRLRGGWLGLLLLVGCSAHSGSPEAAPVTHRRVLATSPEPADGITPVWPVALGEAIANSGQAAAAIDDDPDTWWAPDELPAWLAVSLARPAADTLLVAWDSTSFTYLNQLAAPQSYALQVSSNSRNGRDGSWQTVKEVGNNPVRSRIDVVQAPGARWVRLLVKARWAVGPRLRTLRVYTAARAAHLDCWLILGDSITAQSFNPSHPNSFQAVVRSLSQGRQPVWVGGGTGGDTVFQGRQRLAASLALCPPGSFVGLAYGTNDATYNVSPWEYKEQLRSMILDIRASGRTPLLARPPYSLNNRLPQFVEAVDSLTSEYGLPSGPDLYTWFRHHPDQLGPDAVHPNAQGIASIQRRWAEAAAKARPIK